VREIGIRMTLGAQPVAVQQKVLWRSARLAGIGVVTGVALIMSGAERLLGTIVFGVSHIPARRVARVDPSRVLRTE
jgi:ABC-type lipoprotein release transport system permease subunit